MNGRPYTVLACGRPLRVAFLVDTKCFPPESDRFQALIDAIVDWCNTNWGGRTNYICFFSGDSLSESEWAQLEVADPDSVVAFAPLDEKLIVQLNDRIMPCDINVEDLTEAELDRIHVSLSDGIDTPPTLLNLHRIKTGSSLGSEAPPQLLLFEFAKDCDLNVRRFVHRNFGTYYQWFDPRSGKVRRIAWLENLLPKIPTHSLPVSNVSSLAAALTEISGRVRRGETRTGLRHIAPYQLASVFLTRWPSQELRNRFQLIIGDSTADFFEHWNGVRRKQNWSETHRHQLWVPSTLISDAAFRESLHDWICAFANAGSGDRVEILSHSLAEGDVSELQTFFRKHELPIGSNFIPSGTIVERAKHAYIEAEENTKFFPWSTNDNVQRCTAFSAHEVLALEKADPLDPDDPAGSWMVDLQIEHVSRARAAFLNESWWYIPRRNSGGAVRFLFRQPARITRSGRFTVHVQNREGGIAQRLKPELKVQLLSDYELIRSYLTQPHESPFFVSDARNNVRFQPPFVRSCQVSTKGRYLAALIDLFSDFWTAKTFCERRFWRELFNRLASRRSGTGEKLRERIIQLLNQGAAERSATDTTNISDEILRSIRGQLRPDYMKYTDCARERSKLESEGLPEILTYTEGTTTVQHHGAHPVTRDEMKEGLEALLALGILRLGVERICPRCKVPTWFHIDSLAQHVICPGCSAQSALGATEPWSYGLNSLVQMCVLQGSMGVLHALTVLLARARTFFAFSPSLDLFHGNNAKVWHEVDVVCIIDGELVVGEVKDGRVDKQAFDDLSEVAEIIRPQRAIMFLPLDSATKQQTELQNWSRELQSKLAPFGITAEVFTLPTY